MSKSRVRPDAGLSNVEHGKRRSTQPPGSLLMHPALLARPITTAPRGAGLEKYSLSAQPSFSYSDSSGAFTQLRACNPDSWHYRFLLLDSQSWSRQPQPWRHCRNVTLLHGQYLLNGFANALTKKIPRFIMFETLTLGTITRGNLH